MGRLTLSDLATESFILHPRQAGPYFYDQIIHLCQQAGFYPNVVQEVSACQTRVGLVAVGMGITFVPEALRELEDTAVVYRKLQGESPTLKLAIAYRHDHVSPVIQHFFEIVDEMVKKPKALIA